MVMSKNTLKAEKRSILGRKAKNLRKEGVLPGNVFGKKVDSLAVQVSQEELQEVYKKVGETGLVDLQIDKKTRPVLIHNIQLNPKTDELIHVDFLQVDLKEKVSAEVPVELIGESPAEKQALGTVVQYVNEIEVEALPTDLPEKFEISIEALEDVDQAIYLKDIKVDKSKVELQGDPETIIVKVEPPQKEEVVEPVVTEGDEGKIPVEGETPAEGEATPQNEASEGDKPNG